MFRFNYFVFTLVVFLGLFFFKTTIFSQSLTGIHTIIGIDHYPIKKKWLDLIKDYDISGVIFVTSAYSNQNNVKSSIEKINAINPEKKYLFCIDQEGGRVNRIKFNNFNLKSASFYNKKDSHFIAEQYYMNAKLLSEVGINVNFAPVVDVNRQNKNKVIGDRSYSSDPFEVKKNAQIMIDQQNKFNIISVIKHFPGHGQTVEDSHYKLPIHSDTSSLEAYDIYPFYELINQGVKAVMVSHVMYPSLDSRYPASLSSKVVSDLLINKLNFKGLVFSDDINMGAIKESYSLKDAWKKSVSAGVDQVIMISSYDNTKQVFQDLNKLIYQNKNLYDILLNNSHQILSFKQNHLN